MRETLTYLDLEVEVRPCPKGSERHRAEVLAAGGKETFPFLRDPNEGKDLYESADIVNYLMDRVRPQSLPGRCCPPSLAAGPRHTRSPPLAKRAAQHATVKHHFGTLE